nr:hypothetical protein [Zoogloeaceae bacterium]
MKDAGKRYHQAIRFLEQAETKHEAALGVLWAALENRQTVKVPGLRKLASISEAALVEAYGAAAYWHRTYWLARRSALHGELVAAVHIMRQYDRIARCCGDLTTHPARTAMENIVIDEFTDIIDDTAVPTDGPECELLVEYRGVWRGSGRV